MVEEVSLVLSQDAAFFTGWALGFYLSVKRRGTHDAKITTCECARECLGMHGEWAREKRVSSLLPCRYWGNREIVGLEEKTQQQLRPSLASPICLYFSLPISLHVELLSPQDFLS